MKAFFFIISIFICCQASLQDLGLTYYSTFTGRNLTANYTFKGDKHLLKLGVGYNINWDSDNVNRNQIYYKQMFAESALNRVNLDFTYKSLLIKTNADFRIDFFFNTQLKYSATKTNSILTHSFDSTLVVNTPDEGILYRELLFEFGPFLWVENTVGLSFSLPISNRLNLNHALGLGGTLIIGKEPSLFKEGLDIGYHYLLSTGLSYNLFSQKDP